MKKFIVTLVFFSICIGLFAQDIQIIKKGDKATFDGYIITREMAEKFARQGNLLIDMSADVVSLKKQIFLQTQLIQEKDNEIGLLKLQINSYMAMNNEYKEFVKDMKYNALQNRILSITTGIGFSLALSELIGIGVVAILYNTLPTK
jgi:hypothetical protein